MNLLRLLRSSLRTLVTLGIPDGGGGEGEGGVESCLSSFVENADTALPSGPLPLQLLSYPNLCRSSNSRVACCACTTRILLNPVVLSRKSTAFPSNIIMSANNYMKYMNKHLPFDSKPFASKCLQWLRGCLSRCLPFGPSRLLQGACALPTQKHE